MSKKLREGDQVVLLAGNDKGKTGLVLRKNDDKVIVQGINVKKKHVKQSEQNPQGGILELEAPVHISNVAVCNENGEPLKLKTRLNKKTNDRELYYLDKGKEVVYRPVKKKK